MENKPHPEAESLISVEGAARHLNVSPSFLNKLRCEGGGPVFVRLGRAVRYRRCDLDAWVSGKRFKNTTQPYQENAYA